MIVQNWLHNDLKLASTRHTPSLCISHSTKSDIHEIIMNPPDEWVTLCLMKYIFCQFQILVKKLFSPHIPGNTLYSSGLQQNCNKSGFSLRKFSTKILKTMTQLFKIKVF